MKTSLSTLLLSLALLAPAASHAQAGAAPSPAATPAQVFPTTPVTRPDGKKWRIGYFESGDYSEYPRTLRVTVEGLQKLGWITLPAIPDGLNGRQMWNYLADNAHSDTLEFVRDAWWQPGNFDAAQRPAVREAIKQRLEGRKDIDLIIAMGTWAGQDMAAMGAPVPTIVASTSDAIGARITRSAQDSGLDNLHARVQPERYQRQVRLFHEIVPFKRLGWCTRTARKAAPTARSTPSSRWRASRASRC